MEKKVVTGRDPRYSNNSSTQGGIHDLLNSLKNNIFDNLNVATIGEVQQVDKTTGIVTCKLLPIRKEESTRNIYCHTSLISSVKEDKDGNKTITWFSLTDYLDYKDLVLIVFTNRDSNQNIEQAMKDAQYTTINTEKIELHTDKSGVIISILNKYKGGSK